MKVTRSRCLVVALIACLLVWLYPLFDWGRRDFRLESKTPVRIGCHIVPGIGRSGNENARQAINLIPLVTAAAADEGR